MAWWESILLGIVQGLTEFLPVSSSGHLVIFQKILGFEVHDLSFDVVAHLGTLCSVLLFFRHSIFSIASDCCQTVVRRRMTPGFQLFVFMFVASLPTGLIGVLFKDTFELWFNQLLAVGIFLSTTGALLYATRFVSTDTALGAVNIDKLLSQMSYPKAFIIGLVQGLAIAPGISRAGSTISAGLFLKLDKNSAALFSFMIAIPAMVGAALIQLRGFDWNAQNAAYLTTGFLSSFIFGLIGLSAVLSAVRRGRLDLFSYYLWTVGGLCILVSIF